MSSSTQQFGTYLKRIGVAEIPPRTSPFDPGYDPGTLEGHLRQSAHLMANLKISMSCWMIANEAVSRRKLAMARAHGVKAVAGGGPFEIAVAQGQLSAYLDLCADVGFARIESGQGFTSLSLKAVRIVRMARERGLEVQFEMGSKHAGPFTAAAVDSLIRQGWEWLDAGAVQLVVEARESADGVGLFDERRRFNAEAADRLAAAFGLDVLVFEAPTKASQFSVLDHFGPAVRLGNVRLEELLRVEIYRRGLHADCFGNGKLRPARLTVDERAAVRAT